MKFLVMSYGLGVMLARPKPRYLSGQAGVGVWARV
jgi:hypothetical protein